MDPQRADLDSDVFVPKLRTVGNKLPHHRDTLVILDDLQFDALASEPLLRPKKSHILANNDLRNFVEERSSAAHRARRKRRVKNALAIDRRRPAPSLLERAHLSVQERIAFLHAHVVPAADDGAFVSDHRADWDSPFGQTLLRLVDRSLKKRIAHSPTYYPEQDREVQNSAQPDLTASNPWEFVIRCGEEWIGSGLAAISKETR